MSRIAIQERRKYVRYRANPAVQATVESEGIYKTGMVLNVSRVGAYLLAEAFDFEEGRVNFHLPDGRSVDRRCWLVDGAREGGETMGIAFGMELSEEEITLLKAEGYEE